MKRGCISHHNNYIIDNDTGKHNVHSYLKRAYVNKWSVALSCNPVVFSRQHTVLVCTLVRTICIFLMIDLGTQRPVTGR